MTQQKIESLLAEPRNDLMTGVGAGEPGEVKRAYWEHGDYTIFVGFDDAGRAIWKSFYDVPPLAGWKQILRRIREQVGLVPPFSAPESIRLKEECPARQNTVP